jgi:hypothetical protein
MAISQPHCVVGLAEIAEEISGLSMSKDRISRIAIPSQTTAEDVRRAQCDCEILATKLREYRER